MPPSATEKAIRKRSSRRPFVIGLLGAVGGGKSAVAASFARLGARVLDADAIVHRLYETPAFLRRLARRFGAGILGADGRLDRARTAEIVFRDPRALARLERMVHPTVIREIRGAIRSGPATKPIVLDVPLLLETGLDRDCDALVFVAVPAKIRLERLRRRRNVSRAEAARRARFQLPLAEKRRRAHAVVDNSGPLARTAAQARRLYAEWGLAPERTRRR